MGSRNVTNARRSSFWIVACSLILYSALFSARAWADLRVEPRTHDFGTIDEGAVARVQFVVQNTDEQDAVIKSVRTN
jgi:hypothetical protein